MRKCDNSADGDCRRGNHAYADEDGTRSALFRGRNDCSRWPRGRYAARFSHWSCGRADRRGVGILRWARALLRWVGALLRWRGFVALLLRGLLLRGKRRSFRQGKCEH
jgi:hypothetical protein